MTKTGPTMAVPRRSITDDVKAILTDLRRSGGVIVHSFLPAPDVDALNRELEPHVASRTAGFRREDDSFYGTNTVRIQALAAKSPTFVRTVLQHDVMAEVADDILLPHCGNYWMSQAETIFIGPGNPAQELHRDDLNWSRAQALGIDLQVSVLVALGDYDEEVGATVVIPGSHLWSLDQPLSPDDAIPVEMEPGDAFIYLGSVAHGGGANRTTDRVRKALYMGLLVGWLTPEEAVPFGVPQELARSLPERARRLLGWGRMRGNTASAGASAALQLWQLDNDDPRLQSGTFI